MKHTRTLACIAEIARSGSIRRAAERLNIAPSALTAFEADLALVLQPPPSADLHVLYSCRQPLCALMRAGHPLARETGPVRLRDCLAHAMALPDRSLAIRLH
ncbi:MAG: LysR family transcriptional regulator, partial [Methylobacterium sp.]